MDNPSNFKKFVEDEPTKYVNYLFLDLDGTLRESGTEGHAPITIDAVKVFPWVHNAIKKYIDLGFTPIGITNQSYCVNTFGKEPVEACIAETLRQIGINFPVFYAKNKEQSKPNTYMLDKAVKKYGPANKSTSLFIGDDLQKDKGASENFGIRWLSPEQFRDS